MATRPFQTEQYHDPGPRLAQLRAQRMKERDKDGIEVYYSPYGWIGVEREGGLVKLSLYKKCPCNI
jgi:hypothetical protein